MGMKKKTDSTEKKAAESKETLSRRSAIKRIATMFAASYVGAKVFGAPPAFGQSSKEMLAYLSNAPYNPYSDSVYGSYSSTGYYSITYYTSYSSHYSSVPSPYVSNS
jgi:hypothetical protein